MKSFATELNSANRNILKSIIEQLNIPTFSRTFSYTHIGYSYKEKMVQGGFSNTFNKFLSTGEFIDKLIEVANTKSKKIWKIGCKDFCWNKNYFVSEDEYGNPNQNYIIPYNNIKLLLDNYSDTDIVFDPFICTLTSKMEMDVLRQIATKYGMMVSWDNWDKILPVTVTNTGRWIHLAENKIYWCNKLTLGMVIDNIMKFGFNILDIRDKYNICIASAYWQDNNLVIVQDNKEIYRLTLNVLQEIVDLCPNKN